MGPFMGQPQSEGLGWRSPARPKQRQCPGQARGKEERDRAHSPGLGASRPNLLPPLPQRPRHQAWLQERNQPFPVQMPLSLFFSYNYVSEG